MTNKIVSNYVSALISALLEKAVTLRDLEHNVSKGTLNEILLSGLLMHFLPRQFSAGSGIIVNSEDRQSKETDVIIYDNRVMQPWFIEHQKGIFPIEAVLATIEVKTNLRKQDIVDADTKSHFLLNQIYHGGRTGFSPTCLLFGFFGRGPKELRDTQLGKGWLSAKCNSLAGICLMGHFSWILMETDGGGEWVGKIDGIKSHEEVKRIVAVFADNIRKIAQQRWEHCGAMHHDWVGSYISNQ